MATEKIITEVHKTRYHVCDAPDPLEFFSEIVDRQRKIEKTFCPSVKEYYEGDNKTLLLIWDDKIKATYNETRTEFNHIEVVKVDLTKSAVKKEINTDLLIQATKEQIYEKRLNQISLKNASESQEDKDYYDAKKEAYNECFILVSELQKDLKS